MTAATPTADTGAAPDQQGTLQSALQSRGLRKILILAVAAAVLVPLAHAKWSSGTWPSELTVDLNGPLGRTSDWIIDNRDSHPLFVYFLGHLSNAVVLSVRAVYQLLLLLGWTGVTAGVTLVAWRVAGVRIAATALVSFAVSGVLDMWLPTMQTLALMIVAVVASVVVGALLGLADRKSVV